MHWTNPWLNLKPAKTSASRNQGLRATGKNDTIDPILLFIRLYPIDAHDKWLSIDLHMQLGISSYMIPLTCASPRNVDAHSFATDI